MSTDFFNHERKVYIVFLRGNDVVQNT
jgi:hypothetical protein